MARRMRHVVVRGSRLRAESYLKRRRERERDAEEEGNRRLEKTAFKLQCQRPQRTRFRPPFPGN